MILFIFLCLQFFMRPWMSHFTSSISTFLILKTQRWMLQVTSRGWFPLCHSDILYFPGLLVDRDSFLQSSRKWYGNWAHWVWQETPCWLQCKYSEGSDGLRKKIFCPSILWIISSLRKGKDEKQKDFSVSAQRNWPTVGFQGTSQGRLGPGGKLGPPERLSLLYQ